jgi:hypothetical protein
MKTRSLWQHLLIVFAIVLTSFVLFTFFPSIFPHPEDLSPFAYVIAMLAGIEVFILLKDGRRRWFVAPVLILCLLALLDETGYGSEVMSIKPFYSQTLHVEIRDLHNLIGIAMELGTKALSDRHWDGNLFTQFLIIDGIFLIAGFFFTWLLRFQMPANEERIKKRILLLTSEFWLLAGFLTAIYLFSLPQDPKNTFLLGHSLTRLISAAGPISISLVPIIVLSVGNFANKTGGRSVTNRLSRQIRPIQVISILLSLASLVYQLYAPFIFLPDQQVRLQRISPIVVWLLGISWVTVLSIRAWQGGLRKPLTDMFLRFTNYLRREPAYFYMISAVIIILFAQLIDQSFIPLNTMIQTPNFHVQLWGLWTEEIFEINGAFLFTLSAFYFPKQK